MKKVVILALVMLVAYAIFRQKGSVDTPTTPTISNSVTVTQTPLVSTSDWKYYKSPRHFYSFKYPPTWSAAFFDENNKDIIMGSHSLGNYDYVKIQEYMDHGQVDWQKFVGNRLALKFDLRAEKLGDRTKEQFIEEYYKDFELQQTSKLKFGEFVTFQYTSNSIVTTEPVQTFLTYIPNETVLVADVFIFHKPTAENIESTKEWKELQTIFNSFSYEE